MTQYVEYGVASWPVRVHNTRWVNDENKLTIADVR